MLALWMVGAQYLERLLGGPRYAAVYLVSAVGGSVVLPAAGARRRRSTRRTASSWYIGAVGASGAVFGLFGALLVLNRHLGRSSAGMYATIAHQRGDRVRRARASPGRPTSAAWSPARPWPASSPRPRRRSAGAGSGPASSLVLLVVVAVAVAKYAVSPAELLG